MTVISNYQINTHFTALKQLPNRYSARLSFGGASYGYVLGQQLARTTISVPAGAYVETTLMRSSLDNVNYLTHEFMHNLSNYAYLVFSMSQINSSAYEVKILLNNSDTASVYVPSGTLDVYLRLATAPFNF